MPKKTYRKPLYYQKSKAARETEPQQDFHSSSSTESNEPPQARYSKARDPKGQRKRFREEYNYEDYDNQYFDEQYTYDYEDEYENDSMSYYREGETYYSTEGSKYGQQPRHRRPTETATSMPSDSEWEEYDSQKKLNGRQRRGKMKTSEYMSDTSFRPRHGRGHTYGHENRKDRHSNMQQNYRRNPYRKDVNVYVAHSPIGHKAFRYKKQSWQTDTDFIYDTASEIEGDADEDTESLGTGDKQPHYQVYAAAMEQNAAGMFGQEAVTASRDRAMSLTEDNSRIALVGLKDTKQIDVPHKVESDVIYVPLIVWDNAIKMPKSKIISPESLMKSTEEKAEKPLENTMQVYAAAATDNNNVFQQAAINTDGYNNEPSFTQNLTVFAAENDDKKRGLFRRLSSVVRGRKSKTNLQQSEFPVKKSYINVAPTKGKTISIKSSNSSTSTSSANRKRAKSRKSRKKIKKTKKEISTKLSEPDRHDSKILSVVDPLQNTKNLNSILQGKSDYSEANYSEQPIEIVITDDNSPVVQDDRKSVAGQRGGISAVGDVSRITEAITDRKSRANNLSGTLITSQAKRKSVVSNVLETPRPSQVNRKSVVSNVLETPATSQAKRKSVASNVLEMPAISHSSGKSEVANIYEPPATSEPSQKSRISNVVGATANTKEKRKSVRGNTQIKSYQSDRISKRERSMTPDRISVEAGEKSNTNLGKESPQSLVQKSEPAILKQSLKGSESFKPTKKKSVVSKIFQKKKKDFHGKQGEPLEIISENEMTYAAAASEQFRPNDPPLQLASTVTHVPTFDSSLQAPTTITHVPILESPSRLSSTITRESSNIQPNKAKVRKKISSRTLQREASKITFADEPVTIDEPLTIWGYNLALLVSIFQAALVFLGLSIHDQVIKVFTTYEGSDHT